MKEKMIPVDYFKKIDDLISDVYRQFVSNFNSGSEGLVIGSKRVKVDFNDRVEDKPKIFWHLIGLGENEHKFNVLPCINTKCNTACRENCVFVRDIVDNRVICLYRAERILFAIEIIKMHNNSDDRVVSYINKKGRLTLLYLSVEINYVVILKETKSQYKLITGYPFFIIGH